MRDSHRAEAERLLGRAVEEEVRRSGGRVDGRVLSARARASLDGRDYVIPDDVKALALPAMRHRVVLSPAAEVEARTADGVVQALIDQTEAPR